MRLFLIPSLIAALALTAHADDLGTRTLFDATAPQAWQTEKGVTAKVEDGALVMKTGDIAFGSAASENFITIDPKDALATISAAFPKTPLALEIVLREVKGGTASVQAEWLRQDGSFIKATPVLAATTAPLTQKEIRLLASAPGADRPARFRLKFWLEGRNARAVYDKVLITAPRRWHRSGTTLIQAYDADSKREVDAGLTVEAAGKALQLNLSPDKEYASVALTDRAAYNANGKVLLDLAALNKGAVTVQVLCLDKDGKFLKAVDLQKDIARPGLFEIGFDLYADQFPAGTDKLAFKVWLIGKGATARIDGLFYGALP